MNLILPFVWPFVIACLIALVFTPVVREVNRRIGMIDQPDPRRINRVPIPRGGGIAVCLATLAGYAFCKCLGLTFDGPSSVFPFWKFTFLSSLIALIGLIDDRFGMMPSIKLLGQLVVAFMTWSWGGVGFQYLWPSIPAWFDCLLTVLWVVGAVNAFNLIDGLDGLASGLAIIATLGMAGALMFAGQASGVTFHFTFVGALLGFLRYNYNPASVFLGDCGSMFIGYTISALPLLYHSENSFLVSVGVPLLAMGVPIFDTFLAIVRRTIRRLIRRNTQCLVGNDKVMTADADHLHHRILRATGLNQRRAAWILYGIAAALVVIGLFGMSLKTRAGGLWLGAVTIAAIVIFRDLARIELFDAGRLLGIVAHRRDTKARRRIARLAVPFYVVSDVLALFVSFLLVSWCARIEITMDVVRIDIPVRIVASFVMLVVFRAYTTIWPRAVQSNYLRLLLACVLGSITGSIVVYYIANDADGDLRIFTLAYAFTTYLFVLGVRKVRIVVRDFFYALDCARLKTRRDVSRTLVYGAGLRYRTFRRELVRTTSANDRMIVGLLDDDLLLRGHFIGGIQVLGNINQAPEIINAVNADSVVIACEIDADWLKVVKKILQPCKVKITLFTFNETEI